MKYSIVPVTSFQQNCTLLWCNTTGEGVIVDPGGDVRRILDAVRGENMRPTRILLTHGHVDHVGGAVELAQALNVPIEGPHADDAQWIGALEEQGQMFGLATGPAFEPDRWLQDGEKIRFGEQELEVIHCPGHTPGHVVYFDLAGDLAQVGDVLFRGSIGRTDLPGGSHAALLASIRERLLPLGDAVRFVPGHGPMSTFGKERQTNPFIGAV
jgi:hydroxyacylglutathione hydrolase